MIPGGLSLLIAASMSANYTTLDPANKGADITLSNENLTATKSSNNDFDSVSSVLGVSDGKWYWEITLNSNGSPSFFAFVGVGTSGVSTSNYVGQNSSGYGFYQDDGNVYTSATPSAYGSAWETNGITVRVALDADNGKVWFSTSETWPNSGDPSTGANPAFSGLTGVIYAWISLFRSSTPAHVMTANFGQSAFSYSVPSGYNAGLYA